MVWQFSIDDLLRIQSPPDSTPPRLSPDGQSLALTVAPAAVGNGTSGEFDARNVPINVIGSRITVIDIPNGSQWQPFPDTEVSWGGHWSPDGSMLAAYVVMDGPACLGILHLADRRVQLVRHALVRPFFGFELPVWTPDGRSIIAKLWPADEAFLGDGQDAATATTASDVVVFSHDPDSEGNDTAANRMLAQSYGCDFGTVDVRTHEVRRLARNCNIIGGWRLSPDGTAVAVPVRVEEQRELQQSLSDLLVVPLDGTETRAVAREVVFDYGQSFSWSPDGAHIAFTTSDQSYAVGPRPKGRLLVADAEGRRQPLDLSAGIDDDLRQAYEHPRWSATGDEIFCLVADGVWSFQTDGSAARKLRIDDGKVLTNWIQPPDNQVLHLSADGTLPLLLRDPAANTVESAAFDFSNGGISTRSVLRKRYVLRGANLGMEVDWTRQIAFLRLEAAEHPPEIWWIELTTGKADRLASLNPFLEDRELGSKRLVEFLDTDGRKRRASLLLPPNYVKGRPVPMIVIVYGGALRSQRIHDFDSHGCLCPFDSYLFAANGFAVLQPDVPLGPRDPRRGIPRSVAPAVNRVIDLGIADPARIGVLGFSYGGYSVLALITQTEMFAAAVSCAGAVNLTSYYGALNETGDTTWLGWCESGQARLGGSLWRARDAYIENSSLFYLDRVTTPLLLVSGDDDPGAFAQASETFSALRRLGNRVELRNYRGEGHWPARWSEPNVRDVLDLTIAWFDEHLKSETAATA